MFADVNGIAFSVIVGFTDRTSAAMHAEQLAATPTVTEVILGSISA